MWSPIYRIHQVQRLPISMERCWEFFSNPLNLREITPDWLDFRVDPVDWKAMVPGMALTYRLRPVWGIPVRWMTVITAVSQPTMFIDEQRVGPYRIWHHQHRFVPIDGGVEMTDDVHYVIGFGPLDGLMNRWLVGPRVAEIFTDRRRRLEELFGRYPDSAGAKDDREVDARSTSSAAGL